MSSQSIVSPALSLAHLRALARERQRAGGISYSAALNLVAREHGFNEWSLLARKRGSEIVLPQKATVEYSDAPLNNIDPLSGHPELQQLARLLTWCQTLPVATETMLVRGEGERELRALSHGGLIPRYRYLTNNTLISSQDMLVVLAQSGRFAMVFASNKRCDSVWFSPRKMTSEQWREALNQIQVRDYDFALESRVVGDLLVNPFYWKQPFVGHALFREFVADELPALIDRLKNSQLEHIANLVKKLFAGAPVRKLSREERIWLIETESQHSFEEAPEERWLLIQAQACKIIFPSTWGVYGFEESSVVFVDNNGQAFRMPLYADLPWDLMIEQRKALLARTPTKVQLKAHIKHAIESDVLRFLSKKG